jgi:hypothetical protein
VGFCLKPRKLSDGAFLYAWPHPAVAADSGSIRELWWKHQCNNTLQYGVFRPHVKKGARRKGYHMANESVSNLGIDAEMMDCANFS